MSIVNVMDRMLLEIQYLPDLTLRIMRVVLSIVERQPEGDHNLARGKS